MPVIVVHGGPGGPHRLDGSFVATLTAAGFDVYGYHQFGAGLSSRAEDVTEYTVARHVADLEAIRAEIGADRVALVGESWGGQLIANYMAVHPEHVVKAVVASPGAIWAPAFDSTLTAAGHRDQRSVYTRHPRFLLAHVLREVAGPRAAHALLPDHQMDGVFEQIVGGFDMWAGCPGRQGATDAATQDSPVGYGFWVNAMTTANARGIADPRPVLRDVRTPVLVLRGECDYIAWEVTREYRDLFPHAVMLAIDDAGHVIRADQPELYRTAVRAFLLGTPLPQRPHTSAAAPW